MMSDKYDSLKLNNQLCFPIYAVAKEIIRHYTKPLGEIDLTYTQYITMMVLWERGKVSVRELGEALYLDSGTLTPLLKKLEAKGLVTRRRSRDDERMIEVTLTTEGDELRDKALDVPKYMTCQVALSPEEAKTLYDILYKLLGELTFSKSSGGGNDNI